MRFSLFDQINVSRSQNAGHFRVGNFSLENKDLKEKRWNSRYEKIHLFLPRKTQFYLGELWKYCRKFKVWNLLRNSKGSKFSLEKIFSMNGQQEYGMFSDNFLKRNKTYEFWGLPCLKLVVVSHSYEWKLYKPLKVQNLHDCVIGPILTPSDHLADLTLLIHT